MQNKNNSNSNNKAKEYMAILRTKPTDELIKLRENVLQKFRAEREKDSPDSTLVRGYNIQLSLIGRALSSRKPVDQQSDKFHAVESATIGEVRPPTRTFEDALKEKSLEALKQMLEKFRKRLEQFKIEMQSIRQTEQGKKVNEYKLETLTGRIAAIEKEISTRSEQAAEEAKKDIDEASGKMFGMDKDYLIAGAAGGIIVGAIGYSMGKNILGYAIIGVGLGSGVVWLTKRGEKQKEATQ